MTFVESIREMEIEEAVCEVACAPFPKQLSLFEVIFLAVLMQLNVIYRIILIIFPVMYRILDSVALSAPSLNLIACYVPYGTTMTFSIGMLVFNVLYAI